MFVKNAHLERQLTETAEARAALMLAAGSAGDAAERLTRHVMPRRGHPRIEVLEQDGEVYLANTNYGAAIEEWGASNFPAAAPLRRGVRAAGFRFADEH